VVAIKTNALLSTALLVPLVALADGDEELGKRQFNKCAACHSLEVGVHLAGPSLHGLMGRKVGSIEGFVFSEVMEQAEFVWTTQTLSAFIENPMQLLPGTVMAFGGIRNAEQREALVFYIEQGGEGK
jgi:cytochrome c